MARQLRPENTISQAVAYLREHLSDDYLEDDLYQALASAELVAAYPVGQAYVFLFPDAYACMRTGDWAALARNRNDLQESDLVLWRPDEYDIDRVVILADDLEAYLVALKAQRDHLGVVTFRGTKFNSTKEVPESRHLDAFEALAPFLSTKQRLKDDKKHHQVIHILAELADKSAAYGGNVELLGRDRDKLSRANGGAKAFMEKLDKLHSPR